MEGNMAHRTISDIELLSAALDLFRTHGFDGVSLKQLSDATGLEKASLYYRYPGGKDEIVLAVAQLVTAWFQQNVLEPLKADITPGKKIETVARNLREFYQAGSKSCVTDVLSLPGGPDSLRRGLKEAMEAWINSFAAVARESGLSPALAKSRACDAIIRIEGSLVLARVTGDNSAFERALRSLAPSLTENERYSPR
jgi:TetR/AcrR family transcriptional regulator, lmrAB and yxaGH operons repressor